MIAYAFFTIGCALWCVSILVKNKLVDEFDLVPVVQESIYGRWSWAVPLRASEEPE